MVSIMLALALLTKVLVLSNYSLGARGLSATTLLKGCCVRRLGNARVGMCG